MDKDRFRSGTNGSDGDSNGDDGKAQQARKSRILNELEKDAAVRLSEAQWRIIADAWCLKHDGQEILVLRGIAAGLGDKEIWPIIGISRSTLRTYLARIYTKAGTTNRIGLVMKAMEVLINAHTKDSSR